MVRFCGCKTKWVTLFEGLRVPANLSHTWQLETVTKSCHKIWQQLVCEWTLNCYPHKRNAAPFTVFFSNRQVVQVECGECGRAVGHFPQINIFCVIRRFVWQIVSDFSMLWWHQLRFAEQGTGQTINVIFKPWIALFGNHFGKGFGLGFLLFGLPLSVTFYIIAKKMKQ